MGMSILPFYFILFNQYYELCFTETLGKVSLCLIHTSKEVISLFNTTFCESLINTFDWLTKIKYTHEHAIPKHILKTF